MSARSYAVLAPNASWETFEGTNTWVLHDPSCTRCYIVDPGADDAAHLQRVCAEVKGRAQEAAAILLTHEHVDHVSGADLLSAWLDVPVLSRARGNLPNGSWQMDGAPALQVMPLPGHSSDSVGFVFPADESMVTGDVIFWRASTSIVWPDGDVGDYLTTLDTLETLVRSGACKRFLAAHRRPIDGCLEAISHCRAHRHARLDLVRNALRTEGNADLEALVSSVYADVDPEYYPLCRLSMKAQLSYLSQLADPCLGSTMFSSDESHPMRWDDPTED